MLSQTDPVHAPYHICWRSVFNIILTHIRTHMQREVFINLLYGISSVQWFVPAETAPCCKDNNQTTGCFRRWIPEWHVDLKEDLGNHPHCISAITRRQENSVDSTPTDAAVTATIIVCGAW
jgi:hypothetical protein